MTPSSSTTYSVTYTAGTNGSIFGTSQQTVNYGSSGTAVTPVPANGYHFVNWSDSSIANPRADTNVTANVSVTASFAINTYTLTYIAGANGSISGTSQQTVNYGSSGTAVTPVPANGYHFVNWSDSSAANPRADTNVTANVSVTASFAINTYTLTYTAGTNGSISGTSQQTVNYGSSGTAVTPVPANGYHFVDWSDSSAANPRADTNVIANISVTAAFAQNGYTLNISVNPSGAGVPMVSVNPSIGDNYPSGTSVTLTAKAANGWTFSGWSGSNDISSTTSNPTTITMNSNETVTATFIQNIYTLTTSVNPAGTGTISPNGGSYPSGTSVILTATAATGWTFSGWSGSNDLANTTANPTTVTISGNESVVANFNKLSPQVINNTLPGVPLFTTYSVTYSKALQAGDNVSGFVQLTGQFYSIDNTYNWTFQILGPGGESIQSWTGNWSNNNYHTFAFTASYAGTYKIEISHGSAYSKNLTVNIWPPGWN
jgi:hypothetical protein